MALVDISHLRSLRSLVLLFSSFFLGHHGLGDWLSPPFSQCLSLPFILAFILSPASTCKLNFLGLKTCPVSPYLEWLGGGCKKLKSMVLSGAECFTAVLAAFYLGCSYIVFALPFRGIMGCRAQVRPRPFP